MIKNIYIYTGFLLLLFFSTESYSQSIYKYSSLERTGKELKLYKADNNKIKLPSEGSIFYKVINNNEFWRFYSDQIDDSSVFFIGKYERKGSEIRFFNKDNNLVGSYRIDQGRFYSITSLDNNDICKEESIAVLYDGILTVNTPIEGKFDTYSIDLSLEPEVIGFYLFIN